MGMGVSQKRAQKLKSGKTGPRKRKKRTMHTPTQKCTNPHQHGPTTPQRCHGEQRQETMEKSHGLPFEKREARPQVALLSCVSIGFF